MKTIKKIAVVLLMLVSLQVYSADISIKTKNDNSVEVRVNSINQNENIKIYDEYGEILYSENIDSENYLKVFTLKTLPEGDYFVEYENESQISTASVRKNFDGIVLMSNFNKVKFKPIINQNNQFVTVGLTNQGREDVDIVIRDSEGQRLVNIENINELFVKKTFDTSKLPKGEYIIRVITDKDTFTKVVTVK